MNDKGTDQSARMCRLVCAFVIRKPPKAGFLALRLNLSLICFKKVEEEKVCILPQHSFIISMFSPIGSRM